MMRLLVLTTLLTTSACTTMNKTVQSAAVALKIVDEPAFKLPNEAPSEFKEAVALVEKEKYAEAVPALENFLRQDPTSRWTQAAGLHLGRSLEGLERWTEAIEKYRAVIVATSEAPKIQTAALYRLSFCHEALSDDQQVVAVLNDVRKRDSYLPREIAQAELPARLAGAYARVGNFDNAIVYYRRAESGIAKLKGGKTTPVWLPRTLYFMGSMSLRKPSWQDFETGFRPFSRSQAYLLQAVELGEEPWAARAAQDLIGTYRDYWNVIDSAPVPESSDPVIGRREFQEKQWDRSALILENMTELRARRLPSEGKDLVAGIFEALDEIEKRIGILLAQRPAGEGLTPEAEKRRQGSRGKVISPDDSLERKFLKDSKNFKSLPDTSLPDKTARPEDPNL